MWPDGDDGCGADLIPGAGSLRWALAFPVGMGAVTSLSRHPSSMPWLHPRGTCDRENSPHEAQRIPRTRLLVWGRVGVTRAGRSGGHGSSSAVPPGEQMKDQGQRVGSRTGILTGHLESRKHWCQR